MICRPPQHGIVEPHNAAVIVIDRGAALMVRREMPMGDGITVMMMLVCDVNVLVREDAPDGERGGECQHGRKAANPVHASAIMDAITGSVKSRRRDYATAGQACLLLP
jgi:hypothetical protein